MTDEGPSSWVLLQLLTSGPDRPETAASAVFSSFTDDFSIFIPLYHQRLIFLVFEFLINFNKNFKLFHIYLKKETILFLAINRGETRSKGIEKGH